MAKRKTIDFTLTRTAATRAQEAQEARRAQARHVLATTDWALLRQLETGEPVPDTIQKARAKARKVLAD